MPDKRVKNAPPSLLTRPPQVINVGLDRFAEEKKAQGVPVGAAPR